MIEQKIDELVVAINRLTAAMTGAAVSTEAKTAVNKAVTAAQAGANKASTKPATKPPAAATPPAAEEGISYSTVRVAFMALIKKIDRDAAIAAVAQAVAPAKVLKELEASGEKRPGQFQEILDAIEQALADADVA